MFLKKSLNLIQKWNNYGLAFVVFLTCYIYSIIFVLIIFVWPNETIVLIDWMLSYACYNAPGFELKLSKTKSIFAGIMSYLFFLGLIFLLLTILFLLPLILGTLFGKKNEIYQYFSIENFCMVFYITFLVWAGLTDTVLIEILVILASFIYFFLDTIWKNDVHAAFSLKYYQDRFESKNYKKLVRTKQIFFEQFFFLLLVWSCIVGHPKSKWLWSSLILILVVGGTQRHFVFVSEPMYLSVYILGSVYLFGLMLYIRLKFKFGYTSKIFKELFTPNVVKTFISPMGYDKFLEFFFLCIKCFVISSLTTYFVSKYGSAYMNNTGFLYQLSIVEWMNLVKQNFLQK